MNDDDVTRIIVLIVVGAIIAMIVIAYSVYVVKLAFGLTTSSKPILLIHGYGENARVWDSWMSWLKADALNATAITFPTEDECGTVDDHALDLASQIEDILNQTHSTQVNIIAHSKGGLDARWFIAHSPNNRVDNLVMIATPNNGTAAAWQDLTTCSVKGSHGLWNVMPGSDASNVADHPGTRYYAIAGNYPIPCLFILGFMYTCWAIPNDGWVTVDSALSHYQSLGVYPYAHNDLLNHKDIYDRVKPYLITRK